MTPLRTVRSSCVLACLLALVLGPAAIGCASSSSRLPVLEEAERAGRLARWDQARATRLASELVEAADAVQDALRAQPTPTVGSGQWASFYRLQQTIRRARTEAKQLANMLDSGKGYEETLPVYEVLRRLTDDAAEDARRIFVHSPVMEAILSAGSLVRQLAPYYDPAALSKS